MPRTKLFPVTVVGSWTRQPWLVAALRQRQAGEITGAEFDAVADDAVLAAIKYQEDAGVDIVADGEMRRDNFYSFVVDKLNGMRLMKLSQLMDYVKDRAGFEEILRALDVPAFAIKSPIAVEKISEREGLCVQEAKFLKTHTDHATKIPIPGPYSAHPLELVRGPLRQGLSDARGPRARRGENSAPRDCTPEGTRHRLHPARRALALAGGLRRRGRADLHVRGARLAHRSDPRARIRGALDERDRRRNRRRTFRRARLPRQLEPQRRTCCWRATTGRCCRG